MADSVEQLFQGQREMNGNGISGFPAEGIYRIHIGLACCSCILSFPRMMTMQRCQEQNYKEQDTDILFIHKEEKK